jgi:hypothetical protein
MGYSDGFLYLVGADRDHRRGQPVRCVETGEVFATMRAAAKSVGLTNQSNITGAIREGYKAGGYHWKREGGK